MTIFKIPDAIADKYDGCGYAMASVTGGQIVNLIYLRDILPEFDDERESLAEAIDDERTGQAVRLLQATGEVYAGICSCWEFVVL